VEFFNEAVSFDGCLKIVMSARYIIMLGLL